MVMIFVNFSRKKSLNHPIDFNENEITDIVILDRY